MTDVGNIIAQKEYNEISEKLFPLRREANYLAEAIEDRKKDLDKLDASKNTLEKSIQGLQEQMKDLIKKLSDTEEIETKKLNDRINEKKSVLVDIEGQIKRVEAMELDVVKVEEKITSKKRELSELENKFEDTRLSHKKILEGLENMEKELKNNIDEKTKELNEISLRTNDMKRFEDDYKEKKPKIDAELALYEEEKLNISNSKRLIEEKYAKDQLVLDDIDKKQRKLDLDMNLNNKILEDIEKEKLSLERLKRDFELEKATFLDEKSNFYLIMKTKGVNTKE